MAETAYQIQLRALEMDWRMMSGEGVGDLLPAPPPPPPADGFTPANSRTTSPLSFRGFRPRSPNSTFRTRSAMNPTAARCIGRSSS